MTQYSARPAGKKAIGAILGGMCLANDTTVGVGERQSLEPQLANPATLAQIVLDKLGATFAFAMVSIDAEASSLSPGS